MASARGSVHGVRTTTRWWLVYVEDGVERRLPLEHPLRIGRDPSCDIVLDDPTVSRQHALVALVAGRPFVDASASRNGIRVERARADRIALSPGRAFGVADIVFRVEEATPGGERARTGGVVPVPPADRLRRGTSVRPARRPALFLALAALAVVAVVGVGVVSQAHSTAIASSGAVTFTAASGGTLALPGGGRVEVPAAALSVDAVARAAMVSPAAQQPSAQWPARPVGPGYHIEVGSGTFARPATLTLPVDSAALPQGSTPADAFVAYRNELTGAWVPVAGTLDASGTTVTVRTDHLSSWQVFAIDPNYWLAFLKKAATGNISDFLQGVNTLASPCVESSHGFTIDNSLANRMIEGCLTGVTATSATVRVVNLRSFYLQVTDNAGYVGQSLVAPGGSAEFTVRAADQVPQPVIVSANMTREGLGRSLVGLLLRLMPGNDLARSTSAYYRAVADIYDAESRALTGLGIADDLQSGNVLGAGDALVQFVSSKSDLEVFAAAASAAGAKYDIPALQWFRADDMSQYLAVVNLADLTVTTWEFFGNYFFNAHTEVHLSWPTPDAKAGSAVVVSATRRSTVRSKVAATTVFAVQGHHPGWTDTGLSVRAGERISFQASGEIFWDPAVPEPRVGPAGTSWTPSTVSSPSQFLLPNTRIASLIGKIGNWVFPIGSDATVTVRSSGALALGMNERWVEGAWNDNSGSWRVSVEVRMS